MLSINSWPPGSAYLPPDNLQPVGPPWSSSDQSASTAGRGSPSTAAGPGSCSEVPNQQKHTKKHQKTHDTSTKLRHLRMIVLNCGFPSLFIQINSVHGLFLKYNQIVTMVWPPVSPDLAWKESLHHITCTPATMRGEPGDELILDSEEKWTL